MKNFTSNSIKKAITLPLIILMVTGIAFAQNNGKGNNNGKGVGNITPNAIIIGGDTPPDDPPNPTASTNTCGNKTLTRTGTPPTIVLWYWQTSASGTSQSNSGSTYSVSSSGTYYIRAFDNSTGLWSTGAGSVTVAVNPLPGTPSTPSITALCTTSRLTRGTPPSGITWYWQGKNSSGTSTSNSATTYEATTSGTYYLRGRNNSTGCWGSSRSVSVTNPSPPSAPGQPSVSTNTCGSKVLTKSSTTATNWYWQGTNASGTSTSNNNLTYTVSSSGTYYIRAYDSGRNCWSSATGVSVSINPLPSAPSTPSVVNNCGSSVITRGTPPSGYTWYWQGTNSSGTSTSNSASTYTASSSGTYYLRARNNTTGCWSSSSTGISVSVNALPGTPSSPTITALCTTSLLTRGTPPSGITWYWHTSSTGTSTSLSGTTYEAATSGTYYLRGRNNSTGCWGPSRSIVVSNPAPPTAPDAPNVSTNTCGTKTLTKTDQLATNWYWQGTNASGTSTADNSLVYAVSTSGTYYIRAYDSSKGCWSNPTGVTVSISPLPSSPSTPTVQNNCGSSVLTMGTPPSGYTWYWQGTNSSGTSSLDSNPTYTVTSSGTYYLRTQNNTTGCWSSSSTGISVSVIALPGTPSSPTITALCTTSLLTRGTPPSGITWYWHTSSTGTSTSLSGTTYEAATSGTYYLRGRNNTTLCWGPSLSIVVSNPAPPTAPDAPNVSTNTCGTKTLTKTDQLATNWYWQGTNASGTSTADNGLVYPVNTSGTYYIRAYDSSKDCWSNATGVTVNINPLPSLPATPTAQNNCGSSVLTRGTSPAGYTWYWQGTNSSGTSSLDSALTYTATTSGTYYLRTQNNTTGCWSASSAGIAVTINELPGVPDLPSIDALCTTSILTRVNPPAGITWYWQGKNASGTSVDDANSTYEALISGTYYLRGRNNTTLCWGPSRSIAVSNPSPPVAPDVPDSSTNVCGTKTLNKTDPLATNWYWQGTDPNGTSMLDNGLIYPITTSGTNTYYLRAYDSNRGCWSNSTGVTITVNPFPLAPTPVPTVSTNTCGDKILTRTTSVPAGETWYWQGTDPNGQSTAPIVSGSTFNAMVAGTNTYYIRSLSDAGCWSDATGIDVTVNPYPLTKNVSGGGTFCADNVNTTITLDGSESNIEYQLKKDGVAQGVAIVGSGNPISWNGIIQTGIYTVSATNTTTLCAIDMSGSAIVTVNPLPTVDAGNDQTVFLSSTIILSGTPTGGTWTGSGVTGNTFNAGTAGIGTHVLTYDYTNGNGCTNSDTRTFTVNADVYITLNGPQQIAIGETTELIAVGTYTTIQWQKNGVNITGETGNNLIVDSPGDYSAVVSTSSGDILTTNTITIYRLFANLGMNYIIHRVPVKPTESITDVVASENVDEVNRSTDYFDGLGRPIQTVVFQGSPGKEDIIQPMEYDVYGRQSKEYLPYVPGTNNGLYINTPYDDGTGAYQGSPQSNFYQNVKGDPMAYAEKVFEPSPINRVAEQGAPGTAWQPIAGSSDGKTIKMSYLLNSDADVVYQWQLLAGDTWPSLTKSAYYPAGELVKNSTTDEQGHQVIEFVDKMQRTVLKRVQAVESPNMLTYTVGDWADTYYVYDDFGNLRFVLPPEAIKHIMTDYLNN